MAYRLGIAAGLLLALVLLWDYPSGEEWQITGFRLERSVSGAPYTVVMVVGAQARTAMDPTPPPTGYASYRVRAVNGDNESPPSNVVTWPARPTNLRLGAE